MVGIDTVVSVLGLTSVLLGSGAEVGVEDEHDRDHDDVLAINRIVGGGCVCRGGRGSCIQVAEEAGDEVGIGAGEVVGKGVTVLSLEFVLRDTRGGYGLVACLDRHGVLPCFHNLCGRAQNVDFGVGLSLKEPTRTVGVA